jgi:hypothetical protein
VKDHEVSLCDFGVEMKDIKFAVRRIVAEHLTKDKESYIFDPFHPQSLALKHLYKDDGQRNWSCSQPLCVSLHSWESWKPYGKP